MAHIHLEDGSFSLLWVIIWWALAIFLLGISLYVFRKAKRPDPRRITIAAFCTAAAFAIFQVDIPIAGGVHINLTPLIGILTGPVIGSLIVFITNILAAAIGHGGWGMIGANTLVNFSEVIVAWATFRLLKRWIPGLFPRAFIATILGLFVGNCMMIGIILVSGIQGVSQSSSQILGGLSLIFAINMAVAVIEAFVTGLVVNYMGRVRPDLLGEERK
ncbi:energy-coupling factor ABC transporter permease [uncultured Methanoregula sp.]|uniref:energy-coupling factor ABC transporter permease n=1 Tax=uncultured Methanoregula sp. TaxID=1005933 RepID=UPI002AABAFD7|nr:energy-coupling factor ABC transporter permease [uncultured Methanoregula sp.]